MDDKKITALTRRPWQYVNIDGTGELELGAMMLGFGVLTWLQLHSPDGSVWRRMEILFIWMGAVLVLAGFGARAIRRRITYPRTGYAVCRKRNARMVIAVSLSMVVAVTISAYFDVFDAMNRPGLLAGLLYAASYCYAVARDAPWKWAVAGLGLIGTVLIVPSPSGVALGISVVNLLYGSLAVTSGAVTLVLYLRYNPKPTGEAE
jgi:hypothetical protein